VAKAFVTQPEMLRQPPDEDHDHEKSEGWIFYPTDPPIEKQLANKHTKSTNSRRSETFAKALIAFQKYVESNMAKKAKPKTAKTNRK
jgi:hypothetical protein